MSDTPRTKSFMQSLMGCSTSFDLFCERVELFASTLEAENADLFARLNERTQSHIHASQRDAQTIQQQAIEIERIKGVNAELLAALKLLASHGHADDCLLINRAGESCDCGLDYAHVIIAKAKGVQP